MVDSEEYEPIIDACNDRRNPQVKRPPRFHLTKEILMKDGKPNHTMLRQHLLYEGKLTKDLVMFLCNEAI